MRMKLEWDFWNEIWEKKKKKFPIVYYFLTTKKATQYNSVTSGYSTHLSVNYDVSNSPSHSNVPQQSTIHLYGTIITERKKEIFETALEEVSKTWEGH